MHRERVSKALGSHRCSREANLPDWPSLDGQPHRLGRYNRLPLAAPASNEQLWHCPLFLLFWNDDFERFRSKLASLKLLACEPLTPVCGLTNVRLVLNRHVRATRFELNDVSNFEFRCAFHVCFLFCRTCIVRRLPAGDIRDLTTSGGKGKSLGMTRISLARQVPRRVQVAKRGSRQGPRTGHGLRARLIDSGREKECLRWLVVSDFRRIAMHDLDPERDPDLRLQ